jgi:hypothetical protein
VMSFHNKSDPAGRVRLSRPVDFAPASDPARIGPLEQAILPARPRHRRPARQCPSRSPDHDDQEMTPSEFTEDRSPGEG